MHAVFETMMLRRIEGQVKETACEEQRIIVKFVNYAMNQLQ
jgi:hypothetical protein